MDLPNPMRMVCEKCGREFKYYRRSGLRSDWGWATILVAIGVIWYFGGWIPWCFGAGTVIVQLIALSDDAEAAEAHTTDFSCPSCQSTQIMEASTPQGKSVTDRWRGK